ncbi:short-chain dehydrogenase/reductase [Mesoplasma entomophilum]|uniref:Short-chain dehydrogenase/reductase n=1 Tax=Mesoplasma coleopterae TaxID=324078 RepID=A0A2K8P4Q2_9MOLU|nr:MULTISPECIES: SDR family oxidoreductase [Mesoplasma]ATZ20703.1 short-chain dehydrogenase/reductase [Mesoplasma coleopterae]AVN60192.1 short-chain dehydrogenase/reductase [Mesoplasma entomophilum]AVN62216.1 short-chain dehydrogenase/reductase [Mesoplasma coleopterae]AVN62884.1 short-chain dehydrogenase/reductase [Mesoplasma coleopterae]
MKNKVWFVTGAGQGIGLVVTKELLKKGHKVIATSRNKDKIEQAIGANENLLALSVDIKDLKAVEKAVASGVEKFGGIDILLNNAGYSQMWTFEETDMEDVKGNIETNLIGTLNVTHAVLPVMRKQKHGHIYITSSAWGYGTVPYNSVYAVVKFGLDGFAESISHELKTVGISISSIKPGGVRTNFLTSDSLQTGKSTIEEYAAGRDEWVNTVKSWNGYQDGNPQKYAEFIIGLTENESVPPMHIFAGRDAYEIAKNKISAVQKDMDELEAQATNLHFEN